jgi:hypothetical protein
MAGAVRVPYEVNPWEDEEDDITNMEEEMARNARIGAPAEGEEKGNGKGKERANARERQGQTQKYGDGDDEFASPWEILTTSRSKSCNHGPPGPSSAASQHQQPPLSPAIAARAAEIEKRVAAMGGNTAAESSDEEDDDEAEDIEEDPVVVDAGAGKGAGEMSKNGGRAQGVTSWDRMKRKAERWIDKF